MHCHELRPGDLTKDGDRVMFSSFGIKTVHSAPPSLCFVGDRPRYGASESAQAQETVHQSGQSNLGRSII